MPKSKEESLLQLRQGIDQVDVELLRLLNQRVDLVKQVGSLKAKDNSPVYCPDREKSLLQKLQAQNCGPLPNEHLLRIYTEILSSSRALQRPLHVACLGPEGTFSHMASQDFLGKSAVLQTVPSLDLVFTAVVDGRSHLGVIPLENSLQGSVGQSLDLFFVHRVHICAEFFYRIRHSLLSREKTLETITKVYSHPQPLAQCGSWLQNNLKNIPLLTANSTAHAASLVCDETGAAAIGHVRLAEMHGLNVLAEGIEEQSNNWTRFVVIAPCDAVEAQASPACIEAQASASCIKEGKGDGQKTTLLFTLKNEPGSLAGVLNVLLESSLNLSKLESRPALGENWGYTFFADVEANLLEQKEILKKIESKCHFLKVLGVYNSGSKI